MEVNGSEKSWTVSLQCTVMPVTCHYIVMPVTCHCDTCSETVLDDFVNAYNNNCLNW